MKKQLRFFTKNKRRNFMLTTTFVGIIFVTILAILSESTLAAWWDYQEGGTNWAKRKQLTVTNNSGDNLASGTTVAITLDTKGLGNLVQTDCDDIRIVYQPSETTITQLDRYLVFADGGTCTTSTATKVHFPLQAALTNTSSSTDYYLYYANDQATTPTDQVDAFDIGSKNALLVCPFDGTTECINADGAESPTTETGAIRYGGQKSALSFDGASDYVENTNGTNIFNTVQGTVEMWVYPQQINSFNGEPPNIFGARTSADANRLYLEILENGNLGFGFSTNYGVDTGDTLSLHQWNHIVIQWSNSTSVIVYLNGQSVYSNTHTALSSSPSRINIGAYNGGQYPFTGLIDEIRISNTARYTSNFTPQTSPFVRDDNTVLLYHFDENGDDPRNTGKAIDDSGNANHGTITGAKYLGGLVGVDSSATDEGYHQSQSYGGHNGIFIEEGTTNKITNPSFEHATYNTNWTASGGTASENTTAPYYKFGAKSYKLVLVNTTNQNIYTSINAGNTNTHTLSAYVYRGTSGNIGGTVNNTIAQLYWQGTAQTTTTYTDMGGGWWRLSYSAAGTADAQNYGVTLLEDSGTIYIDGMQLEEKSYATTYADGSLGTSYSWTGTANDSTSTRAAGDLEFSATSNINPDNGSISFWVKPNFDDSDITNSSTRKYIINSDPISSKSLSLYRHENEGQGWWFQAFSNTDGLGNAATITKGKWQHIVITWDGTNLTSYVNTSSATDTYTDTSYTPTTLFLGKLYSDSQYGDLELSDFRIYDNSLNSTEVTDLYYSGLVAHSQDITVDRFSADKGQDPIAIWHFDEGYGTTANDSSQYDNDLTISGATWFRENPQSSVGSVALQFDGTDDYAFRSHDTDFNFGTGSFSISGNFRHPSTVPAATETILSKASAENGVGYKIYMNTSGYICFGIDDTAGTFPEDSACSTVSYADSRWHHFEAVKADTTSITLYIDGQQVGQNTSLGSIATLNNTGTFYLGIDADGTSNPYQGFLDEIVIYPYARSSSQVLADTPPGMMTTASFGSSANDNLQQGLVGWWKMDEAGIDSEGESITDHSGNSNTGTLYGDNSTGDNGSGMDCTTSGKFGTGCNFDGTDDYINAGSSSMIDNLTTNEFTTSAWYYANSSCTTTSFTNKFFRKVSSSSGWSLNDNCDGASQRKLYFYVVTSGTDVSFRANVNFNSNTWHHISVTYSSVSMTPNMYLDGQLLVNTETSSPTGTAEDDSGGNLTIGGNSGSETINGTLDDVRIYNRALSPSEISQLYRYAPGPVAYYDFNENTGTTNVYDKSGNGNHGTMNGSMTESDWVQGKFGSALDFDGVDDVITINTMPISNYPFTLSAWAKPNSSGNARTILSIYNDAFDYHSLLIRETNCVGRAISDNNNWQAAEGTSNNCDGDWHFLTALYTSATDRRIYVDGILEATDTDSVSFDPIIDTIAIGDDPEASNFLGLIDEVKIYNYARTQEQIIEDMNGGHPVGGSPVGSQVGYWKFDEGYGDTAYDSSPHGNNGDLGDSDTTCPATGVDCPTWTTQGKFGHALSFDTNDIVRIPYSSEFAFQTDYTLSGWIKTSNTNTTIMAKSNTSWSAGGMNLYIENSTGYFGWSAYGIGTCTTSINVADNQWHHILASHSVSTSTINIFVDGNNVKTCTNSPPSVASYDFWIGSAGTSGSMNGLIDEVKIYSVALTPEQVAMEYNQGQSAVMGAVSTETDGSTASFSASREYCVPGDATACDPPVAHWKFDEKADNTCSATADVCDTSGNENHGTATGGPVWKGSNHCHQGACMEFDGSDDYVSTTTQYSNPFPFSISAWFKTDTTTGGKIIGFGNLQIGSSTIYDRHIYMTNSGLVYFGVSPSWPDTPIKSTSSYNDNQWHHVEATASSSDGIKLFIDNLEVASDASYTSAQNSSGYWRIGYDNTHYWEDKPTSYYFDGLIDDVRIYNYARTGAQIAWDYNRGVPIAHYKLDECSGTTVYNSALNANGQAAGYDGTISFGTLGNTSTGTCNSGVTTSMWHNGTDGKSGASLHFDGTDDYVNITGTNFPSLGNTNFSFSTWVYITSNPGSNRNIFIQSENPNSFVIWLNSTGRVNVAAVGNMAAVSLEAIPQNQWVHIAYVRPAAGVNRIFINGIQVVLSTDVGSATFADTALDKQIGYEGDVGTFFRGKIDDMRFYTYALTSDQIKLIYNDGAVRFGN